MFYLIGLGLREKEDISVKGLDIVKKADEVYAEFYTAINSNKEELEEFFGREIILLDRKGVEQDFETILPKAKEKDIVLLTAGDPLSATTHISTLLDAKDKDVEFEVIHSSSIFSAVAETGLQLYKFGYAVSITFDENVNSYVDKIRFNRDNGLHTLCLLDLNPSNNKFLSSSEAIKLLLDKKIINEEEKIVVLSEIGSRNRIIKYDFVKNLINLDIKGIGTLIIPGKMHFMEEEALEKLYG